MSGIGQGSLNYPFAGNQTMQIYSNFEGFPQKIVPFLGWCHIMTPVGGRRRECWEISFDRQGPTLSLPEPEV